MLVSVKMASAGGSSSKWAATSGGDADVGSANEDQRLSKIFNKMKDASAGLAINLDSTFGGGRCNCVCKDNK